MQKRRAKVIPINTMIGRLEFPQEIYIASSILLLKLSKESYEQPKTLQEPPCSFHPKYQSGFAETPEQS